MHLQLTTKQTFKTIVCTSFRLSRGHKIIERLGKDLVNENTYMFMLIGVVLWIMLRLRPCICPEQILGRRERMSQ